MDLPKRILVVEDDRSILLGLELTLQREGYEVGTAEDGREGLRLALEGHWDLLVLDVMLPGRNGFEIVASVREQGIDTSVLMLSARSSEIDRVMGLDLGADDYVTKPFSVAELLARVRALLRRKTPTEHGHLLSFGHITIDTETHQVLRENQPVELTSSEFQVLLLLARTGTRVLSRERILDEIRGPGYFGSLRSVDNFIAQLRAKLEEDPSSPQLIRTVRGFGYRLS